MADVTQNIDVRIQTAVEASNSAKTLGELRASIKELNSLALESGDAQSAAYLKAAEAAGQARDRVVDLKAQTAALSGSKLEGLSNSFTLVGNSISSMDFGMATSGLKGFTSLLKSFSFAEIGVEIKALTVAFGELALAILANPITWIAVAIIAIIAAFGKLSDVVEYVSLAVRKLTEIWYSFTDALGLTHNQLEKNTKAVEDYVNGLEAAAKANQELAKAQGQTGNTYNYQVLNAEVLKANAGLQKQLGILNLTKDKVQEINQLLTNDANWNKMILTRYKPTITPEEIEAITKAYIDLGKATNDVAVFTAQLTMENKKLADQVSKNMADLYVLGIRNHRQAELEKEKITYEAVLRDSKIKEDALNAELTDIKNKNRTATEEEAKQLKIQKENVENQLSVINSEKLLAAKTLRVNSRKINDKYDIEDKANLLKNLKSDFDAITNNNQLTENQKFLLHEDNLKKQQVASDEYFDRQIKAEQGDAAKVAQLAKDKEVAHEQLEAQKFKVSREYYDKSNGLLADSIVKNDEKNKKQLETEKALYDALFNYKLQHLQQATTLDEMELANLRTTHNKKLELERELLRNIQYDRDMAYGKQRTKEIADDEAKKQQEIINAGANNALIEQIEAQHKINLEDIDKRYNANVKQNAVNTEEAIRQSKFDGYKRAIELGSQTVDALSAISDAFSAGENEKVKRGEMSDRDAKKKQFNRGKILGVASAVMNTAQGITSALAIQNYAGAAITGVIGAAQIAKILATNFDDSSSSSGSTGVSSVSPTAPDMGTTPSLNTSSMYNASAFYGIGTQRTETSTYGHRDAQRVYVVESDITSVQKKVQVNEDRATLSGVRTF